MFWFALLLKEHFNHPYHFVFNVVFFSDYPLSSLLTFSNLNMTCFGMFLFVLSLTHNTTWYCSTAHWCYVHTYFPYIFSSPYYSLLCSTYFHWSYFLYCLICLTHAVKFSFYFNLFLNPRSSILFFSISSIFPIMFLFSFKFINIFIIAV